MKKALPALNLICSNDDADQARQFIEIKKGIATAVGGAYVAQMNLRAYSDLSEETIAALEGKKIHRDIWEAISDASSIEVEEDRLHYERGAVRAFFDISCPFTFPDYSVILSAIMSSAFDPKTFISLPPEWIAIAKKLFGDRDLTIRFYQSNNTMIVFPSGKETPKAFIAIIPNSAPDEDQNTVIDFSLS